MRKEGIDRGAPPPLNADRVKGRQVGQHICPVPSRECRGLRYERGVASRFKERVEVLLGVRHHALSGGERSFDPIERTP